MCRLFNLYKVLKLQTTVLQKLMRSQELLVPTKNWSGTQPHKTAILLFYFVFTYFEFANFKKLTACFVRPTVRIPKISGVLVTKSSKTTNI